MGDRRGVLDCILEYREQKLKDDTVSEIRECKRKANDEEYLKILNRYGNGTKKINSVRYANLMASESSWDGWMDWDTPFLLKSVCGIIVLAIIVNLCINSDAQ